MARGVTFASEGVNWSHKVLNNIVLCIIAWQTQGAKIIFTIAFHAGKLKLAFTSPDVTSSSPKSFLTSRIDFTVLLLFKFLKKPHLPARQVKTEFTSPGLLDSTFFARCRLLQTAKIKVHTWVFEHCSGRCNWRLCHLIHLIEVLSIFFEGLV